MSPAGEILWHDTSTLSRALPTDESAETSLAPIAIAQAARLAVTHDAIWVAGSTAGTLECYDLQSLARRRVLNIDGTVLDLAAAERGTLLVLTQRGSPGHAVHSLRRIDCGGRSETLGDLDPCIEPVQMACLQARNMSTLVALLDRQGRLHGLTVDTSAQLENAWMLEVGGLRRCFKAHSLASDGRERLLLAGAEGAEFGGKPYVVALDRDGAISDALQLSRPATGVVAGRGWLVVSHADGIAVHARATVAGDAAGVSCDLLTPLLRAPDSAEKIKWQRADIWASLPVGTTLELRYGWTEDSATRRTALALTRDARLSPSSRLSRLLDRVEHWSTPVIFSGAAGARNTPADSAAPYSFPLHEARATELWLHVRLRGAPRAALPSLTRMHVSFGQSEFLQQLPSIYRREALEPASFLAALVGTLEAGTQDIDRRIGSLGSLVHPDTAPVPWLDEIAEWLGLPWDDALAPEQKQALVSAAARLAAGRGTRAGLTTLLESLFPGEPARFRLTDLDVDYGFAALGGGACRGTALPAVLAGLPRSAAVLNRRAILGAARLPCEGVQPSATTGLAGRLRIDLAVGSAERTRSQPWLARLIESVVPANLRVELRWHLPRGTIFDGFGELPAAPVPHLGGGAITGIARLPDAGRGTFLS
jgi:phage tail-like protein